MREIESHMTNLDIGERESLLSNAMNGVKRLPATWTPESAHPPRSRRLVRAGPAVVPAR